MLEYGVLGTEYSSSLVRGDQASELDNHSELRKVKATNFIKATQSSFPIEFSLSTILWTLTTNMELFGLFHSLPLAGVGSEMDKQLTYCR